MSAQNGELPEAKASFPEEIHRANLYVYDPFGRIDWFALVPQNFLGGRYFTLGRGADCDITLNDGSVSTRHACVALTKGALMLRDLGSTNGTTLNGELVTEAVLQHGDVIRLGATEIRFLLSHRQSPLSLILEFVAGPNAGRTLPTYGSSTSLGRQNCAINLQGPAIAAQHLRLDAFGRDLIYLVNLQRDAVTLLNGQRIQGIYPAAAGDVVTVGEHGFRLEVQEDASLMAAVPRGEGTLLITGAEGDGHAPASIITGAELARLQAHIDDLGPSHKPLGDAFMSPTCPPESVAELAASARSSTGPTQALPFVRPLRIRPGTEAEEQPEKRRRLPIWPIALPLGLGVFVGAAALLPLKSALILEGELQASSTPIVAPIDGRLQRLSFQVGDKVEAGQTVAILLDSEIEAQREGLASRLAELEEAGAVLTPADNSRPLGIAKAEAELVQASARLKETQAAFERREVELAALESARALEKAAAERLQVAKRTVRPRPPGARMPSPAAVTERASLEARRQSLDARLERPVTTSQGGFVAEALPSPSPGSLIKAGTPLLHVVNLESLTLRTSVSPDELPLISDAETAELVAEGLPTEELALAPVGPMTGPDGRYPLHVPVNNHTLKLRPGQRVKLVLKGPRRTVLSWLLEKAGLR